MTCPRCQGLLVPETVHDGAYSEDLLRCVNCCLMAKEGEMPRFTDEAHRFYSLSQVLKRMRGMLAKPEPAQQTLTWGD